MKKIFLVDITVQLIILIFLLFSMQSCMKDNFDFDKMKDPVWNPSVAIPLVNTSLAFSDILKQEDHNGNIHVDSTQFCTLIYNGKLFSLSGADMLPISNQQNVQNYALTSQQISTLTTTGTVTVSAFQMIDFNPGSYIQLDSIYFKSGNFGIAFNSDFQQNGTLQITFPRIRKNGVALSQTIPISYNGGIPFNVNSPIPPSATFDLAGCIADLTNGGTTHNRIRVNYTFTFTNSGAPPTTINQVYVVTSSDSQKFDKAFGYIGQQILAPDADTVLLTVFEASTGVGSFNIVDPSIDVKISNSLGVPVQASLIQFDAYQAGMGYVPITGSGIPNPLPINSPSVSQIGQSMNTSFTLNKNNSSVYNIINNKPTQVLYQLNALSNPNGNTGTNFIIDSSRFSVDLSVIMPLYGTAKDFQLQDTLNFQFNDIENVETLLLRTSITNGFPIELGMQVYFTDENFTVLDSMINSVQPVVMTAAPVDPTTGRVTVSTQKTTDILLDQTKVPHLVNAKKILIKSTLATLNQGTTNVKIYADYKLDVHIGAMAKMKIHL